MTRGRDSNKIWAGVEQAVRGMEHSIQRTGEALLGYKMSIDQKRLSRATGFFNFSCIPF
jgi:hypothetical protein